MAGPFDNLDPFAPTPIDLTPDPVAPWSWVPSEWAAPVATPQVPLPELAAPEATPMQPGLGVPQQAVDAAAPREPIEPGLGVPQLAQGLADAAQPPQPPALPPLPAPERTFDAVDPRTWANPLGVEDRLDLMQRNPLEAAALRVAEDDAAQQEALDRKAEIDRQRVVQEEQDRRLYEDTIRKADEESAALAQESIDPNGYVRNLSPLGFLSTFVSVVVGGLHAATPAGRGRNVGLEMLNAQIERDIEAQKLNQAKRGNAIAEMRKRGLTDYQATQGYRAAQYANAIDALKTEMQNYNPVGTRARRIAEEVARVQSAQAQALEAARRQHIDEQLKLAKDRRETLKAMGEARAADDKHLLDQRKLAGGTGPAKLEKQKFTAAQLGQMYPGLPVPTDGIARTPGEFDKWLGTQGKGEDLINKRREEDRKRASFRVEGIATKSGVPFEFATPKEAEEFRSAKSAAEVANELVNDISNGIARHGGESDFIKSADWQNVTAKIAVLDNMLRLSGKMGTLDEGAATLVARMRGGADPTSWIHDARPGLKAARSSLVSQLNAGLRQQPGYDGPMLSVSDIGGDTTNLPKPTESARDVTLKKITTLKPVTNPEAYNLGPDQRITATGQMLQADAAETNAAREQIDALAQRFGAGDAEAGADLRAIMDKAVSPVVKQWARDALTGETTSNVLSDSASPEAVR